MGEILTTSNQLVEASFDRPASWQWSLKSAIRSSQQLLEQLGLDAADTPRGEADFPVFVPREFAARMKPGQPNDPLLLQVLATEAEDSLDQSLGQVDAVGDSLAERLPGLLQKYSGRALLMVSGRCAVHCRYCFRRHYPYHKSPIGKSGWQPAIDALQQDSSIREIILSGGDPLSVVDESLGWLLESIDQIPHVSRIRIHSRLPVVIPSRVTDGLVGRLSKLNKAIFLVLHINHAQEFDNPLIDAIGRLKRAGVTLLNQAVLLRGINDSLPAQLELCQALVDSGVIPYYLHQLDRVRGALHFEVSDPVAIELVRELRGKLPGYAVPQLVREIAGQPSKSPIVA